MNSDCVISIEMASKDELTQIIEDTLSKFKSLKPKILRVNQTKNEAKLESYKLSAFNIYNNFIEFNKTYFDALDEESKNKLKKAFASIRDYMSKFTAALKLDIDIPLDIKIRMDPNSSKHFNSEPETEDDLDDPSEASDEYESEPEREDKRSNLKNERQFLALCASTINKDFDGEPNHLQSFIDKIDLLKNFAETSKLKVILLSFAVAKLNKTTRSKITTKPRSIESLICALRGAVKHESSDVIEGRLLSIKSKTMEEFAQKAEKLADSFRQALILEEIGPTKANEMAIAKTVQLCRSRTNAPDVKAVLRSTPFKSVEQVISTLITCSHEVQKEREHEFYVKNSKNKNLKPQRGQQNEKQKHYERKHEGKPQGGQSSSKNDFNKGKPKFGKPKNPNQGQFPNGQVYHMAGNDWGTPQSPQGEYYQQSTSAQQPRQNQSQNHRTSQ